MLFLRNITKIYRSKNGGECRALDSVTVSFDDKGLVFVSGKSGSGKTTLLNIASGMDVCDSGEIIIDGKSSKDFKQADFDVYRNTYAGYIFQDFGLIDELNIKENISLGLELQGVVPTDGQIEETLKSVGLEGYGERNPFELSGGQRQRVSIARALIKNPKIVFADEPTGSLDAQTGKQIFGLFKELSKSRLVIIISHDADSAVYYGDRVITLSDGKIISDLKKVSDVDVDAAKREYQKKIDEAFAPYENGADGFSEDTFRRTQTKFPLTRASKIGFSNFKNKKARSVFMLFLSIIALTVFCLADVMRNYDAADAAVNTFKNLKIDTVLLINNKIETGADGTENKIPIEFTGEALNSITDKYSEPYNGIACGIKIPPYSPVDGETVFINEISQIIETTDEFGENTLRGFYDSTLKSGRYPRNSKNSVEVLISDYLADGIMFFGAAFGSGDVIPNSGYDKILNAYFDYSGVTIRIVGIFNTDYKNTAYDSKRTAEYKFNYANVYSAALTAKGALFENAKKNLAAPAYAFFDTGDGEDLSGRNLTVIGAENALQMLSATGPAVSVKFKNGYSYNTLLNDGELIVGTELLCELTAEFDLDFDNVTTADFEDLRLKLILSDPSREPSFTDLRIVGVFDDSADAEFYGAVLTSPSLKNAFIEKSLAVTNAYLPLAKNAKETKTLLKYLDGANIQYLSYASAELTAMDTLFELLGNIMGGVSLVLFLFVMLLIFNFISSSVASKQKEIGILRAMGARGIDTAKIFIIEGAALFVLSLAAAVILSFAGVAVLNAQLTKMFVNTITVLTPSPLTFIIAAVGAAAIVTVASLIPLIRITKMKPIDAVKTV
jgi:ABC-type lipoprotein export system ATPase subunit/ABC-type antimicrobial peptide transport system permease subunit